MQITGLLKITNLCFHSFLYSAAVKGSRVFSVLRQRWHLAPVFFLSWEMELAVCCDLLWVIYQMSNYSIYNLLRFNLIIIYYKQYHITSKKNYLTP